jgi:hypothetical protein
MTTWLVAIVGGAVGTILGWLLGWGGRVAAVGREVKANDRALRVEDDHLETWVADDTLRLRRELRNITETLNTSNLLYSGHHGQEIARAKERALQAYRDQERTARSLEAEIAAREGWLHSLVRAWCTIPFGLTAPDRVKAILDEWAASVTRHRGNPAEPGVEVDDPRKRTVETTKADLANDSKALT